MLAEGDGCKHYRSSSQSHGLYCEELISELELYILFLIIHTYRSGNQLQHDTDMCVGSSRCCVLLLGHSSSFQLPTVQTLGEDSYCSHHQCLTGSVSPTTICIATSYGWPHTVLFNSIILCINQKLWLLHYDTPNNDFCWNHNIHTDLHKLDII